MSENTGGAGNAGDIWVPAPEAGHGGRFDAAALYAALDTRRQERGLSWQQVASEVGVSASTLTRTRRGGRMEVDGMLAMVRWLGRTAESFTHVGRGRGRAEAKPGHD